MKNAIKVKVTSDFWLNRQRRIKEGMIPYQWEIINDLRTIEIAQTGGDMNKFDSEKSYVVNNFKVAAGLIKGERRGMVFQDSDAYKWLEAAAYTLADFEDPDLEEKADSLIDLIGKAQQDDGYLNTYFTVNEPDRKYQSLYLSHELYCAGHFIEAAVAYYTVTNKTKVLDIACRLADNIDANFGPEEGKIHGADGHEEIELALLRLYTVTKNEKYLDLATYLLEIRGKDPEFFIKEMKDDVKKGRESLVPGLPILHKDFNAAYFQADKTIYEQEDANGHAVRVVYLCSAIARLAYEKNDPKLLACAQKYYESIIGKRMYVTGGIGSSVHGEKFTADYDLPNDSMYCESCASVGLTFFMHEMSKNKPLGQYGDVAERAVYNTVLGGMNLNGKGYFYVNPLEVKPEYSNLNPGISHVKTRRPSWFACACCPPNIARLVMSIGDYAYFLNNDTLYCNMYMANDCEGEYLGKKFSIKQEGNYPLSGEIKFTFNSDTDLKFGLRIPEYADVFSVTLNGNRLNLSVADGYVILAEGFKANDEVILNLELKPQLVMANPLIKYDINKVCLTYGPLVYCAEEVDNGNNLQLLKLGEHNQCHFEAELLDGVNVIDNYGKQILASDKFANGLYQKASKLEIQDKKIRLIPYYAWCNRDEGEMTVWFNI